MSDADRTRFPRDLGIFGSPDSWRKMLARPQRVRGEIDWEDERWWAIRRYRAVRCVGAFRFAAWAFTAPSECGARFTRDGTFELVEGDLVVEIRRPPLPTGEPGRVAATRWRRGPVAGLSWSTVRDERHVFAHQLSAPGAADLRVVGTSTDPHAHHWLTAVVQSAEPP